MVACPKCKGGCDLCAGTGEVPDGVARVYVREETRATTRVSKKYVDQFRWPDEVPTKPDVIRIAERRKTVLMLALVVAAVAILSGIVALIRYA